MAVNQNYIFPNVSVRERIVGPQPFDAYWRNTIGVAGVFPRGPLLANINSREEFVSLYGEDESSGSLFIKSAMLQGATNFIISRVMPSATNGEGSIFLQASSNAASNEAFVGSGSTRTIGLTFSTSYVGSAYTDPGVYLGAPVNVAADSAWKLSSYNGSINFRFKAVETVDVAEVNASPYASTDSFLVEILPVTGDTTSTVRKITATGGDAETLKAVAKPGLALTMVIDGARVLTDFEASADSINDAGNYLILESYAFLDGRDTYSVLVRGKAEPRATTEGVNETPALPRLTAVKVSAVTSKNYVPFAYTYSTADGNVISTTLISSKRYESAGLANGFLLVGDKEPQELMLTSYNSTTNLYGVVASGITISVGDTNSAEDSTIIPGSSFLIPVASASVSVGETTNNPTSGKAFAEGLSGIEVLKALRDAIYRSASISAVIKDVSLNDQILPFGLTFSSTILGDEASRVSYKLRRQGTANDLLYGDANALYNVDQKMLNATDGMTTASLFLYDVNGRPIVYIEALSPGNSNIKVTVRPSPPGQFRLEVRDDTPFISNSSITSESFTLSNFGVDKYSGLYTQTTSSNLIRAYFVPVAQADGEAVNEAVFNAVPMRIAPPANNLTGTGAITNPMHPSYKGVSYLKDIPLVGGSTPPIYNPRIPREQDYIAAVNRLESTDCAIIACDSVDANDVRYEAVVTELVSQAESSSTMNGLRIAVIAAPRGLSKERARFIAQGLSSSKVVVVAGWATLPGRRTAAINSVSPTGLYAGKLATIEPHVSPASASEAGAVLGVEAVDTKNSPDYLNELTMSRLEVLHLDPATRSFKFLNGLTTGLNSNDKYVSIRRMANQIIMDLHRNLQWARSASHTPELRRRIASACDAYMTSLARDGRIASFRATVCDGGNNTQQTVSQSQLFIRLSYTPIYPADFIYVELIRDVTEEFSISVGA